MNNYWEQHAPTGGECKLHAGGIAVLWKKLNWDTPVKLWVDGVGVISDILPL